MTVPPDLTGGPTRGHQLIPVEGVQSSFGTIRVCGTSDPDRLRPLLPAQHHPFLLYRDAHMVFFSCACNAVAASVSAASDGSNGQRLLRTPKEKVSTCASPLARGRIGSEQVSHAASCRRRDTNVVPRTTRRPLVHISRLSLCSVTSHPRDLAARLPKSLPMRMRMRLRPSWRSAG